MFEKLAKAMAGRKIKVVMAGSEAITNGTTITLPAISDEFIGRDETLNRVLHGYTDHEVGHCKYSNFKAFFGLSPATFKLVNTLEDIRIERKMIAEYPGSRQNLQHTTDSIYGYKLDKTNPLHWLFAEGKRANKIKTPDSYQAEVENMFGKNVMDKVLACKNTSEIIGLAKSLLEYVKKPKYDETSETDEKGISEDSKTKTDTNVDNDDESESKGKSDDKSDTDNSGKSDSDDKSDTDNSGEGNSDCDDEGESRESGNSKEKSESKDSKKSKSSDNKNETDNEVDGEDDKDAKYDNSIDSESSLEMMSSYKDVSDVLKDVLKKAAIDSASQTYTPLTTQYDIVQKLKGDKTTLDKYEIQKKELGNIEATQRKIVRLFKARTMSRWETGKEQGKVNTKALTSVKTGNRLVFKDKVVSHATDTAVTLLLDFSASMTGSPIREALKSTIIFMEAFEAAGIKTEVLGYTTVHISAINLLAKKALKTGSYFDYGRREGLATYVIKEFDERLSNEVKSRLYAGVKLKNNADSESVVIGHNRLSVRKEKRKVMFVLTDGDVECQGNNTIGSKQLEKVVSAIQDAGKIEIIGIDFDCGNTHRYYKKVIKVNSSDSLADKLLSGISEVMGVK